MTICIFDQYFSTLGGGERHIGVVAEILLKKHELYLIHCGAFDREDIGRKLNLNLEKVVFIDTLTDKNINEKVKEIVQSLNTELFINATHFSQVYFENIPTITLVFFPKYIYPRPISTKENIKYKLGKALFSEYNSKIKFDGFSYPEYLSEGYGRWSSKKSIIQIRGPFNQVKIFYKNIKNGIGRKNIRAVSIGESLNYDIDASKIYFSYEYPGPVANVELSFNTFVPADVEPGNTDRRDLGLFITRVWINSFSWITRCMLQLWSMKGVNHYITRLYIKSSCIGEQLEYKTFLKKNTLLLSNSKYTTGWINKLYGKEIKPFILYPPTMTTKPLYSNPEKKNYLISVGRFFTGDHSKKQLEMIKFFKTLYDTCPMARDYTFHVCGGTHKEERNQKYLDLCYKSSEGYPIVIHPDIKFDDLRDLYASSKIFWHAAGLYEHEENAPDKFEHLGFTTIEAMASGCVPVVIGIAGQLEVVKDNVDGFLWNNAEELISKTYRLIYDEELRKTFSAAAIRRAGDFSYKHFEDNVITAFKKINIEV